LQHLNNKLGSEEGNQQRIFQFSPLSSKKHLGEEDYEDDLSDR
jgi:hypothetical protein